MLEKIYRFLKEFISPSKRHEIKSKLYTTLRIMRALSFWKWRNAYFSLNEVEGIVHYFGKPQNHEALIVLLGLNPHRVGHQQNQSKNSLMVTDFPTPNTLSVPYTLSTIVPLNRTVEDVLSTYSRSLRRSIHSLRPLYRSMIVTDENKIESINAQMLMPYANARHEKANHLSLPMIKKLIANGNGRLDLLLQGDEEVGCHFGNSFEYSGKKYWHVSRLGYFEHIYSDFKKWGEVNSINLHLALENAIDQGYDFCSYGNSLAKPGSGLLEWKRRRKGFLSDDQDFYFYVKLPKEGAAKFLWQSPLFSIEQTRVCLHLGVPSEKTLEDFKEKFHEMGYAGLYKVYIHSEHLLTEEHFQYIQDLFVDQAFRPQVINQLVNA